MPSPAFLLSRHLSPQTTAGKAYEAPGGIPEFTGEDLRCATTYIGDAVAWMAVDAKWLGGARSHDSLLKMTEARSWQTWDTSYFKKICELRQGMMANWLLSELAYTDWLHPHGERSDIGCATFLSQYPDFQVKPEAYRRHFKAHVVSLSNWLQDKEQLGLRGISSYLAEAA